MKLRHLYVGLLPIGLFFAAATSQKTTSNAAVSSENPVLIRSDFKKYFDNCQVEGAIAIFDNQKNQWIVSDTIEAKQETLPASTFKIVNLLIALETKTIANENEIVKWTGSTDTLKYGNRPEIYHDMTVKEAFEVSAGWVFVELAKKIGKENYKKYLTLCSYGNLDFSHKDDDFWNFGAFAISPMNQIDFLKSLYDEKLPFSKRNIEIVKKVMIVEQKKGWVIRAKTGWTRENGVNTGWWVGYLENKNGVYFFATRLLQDRKLNNSNFGSCRKEITKAVFKELNLAH